MDRRAVLVSAFLFEGLLLLLAVGQGALFRTPPFAALAFTWHDAAFGVAGTAPLFGALWWTGNSSWAPVVRLREQVDAVARVMFLRLTPVDLAVIAVLAGVVEEAFFRGVLQEAFSGWLTPAWGLAISSVLFGLVHFVTPLYAVLAGLIGLWLGALFLWSGNLLVPIVAHAVYDFVALLWLVAWIRRRPPPDEHPD